MISSSYSLSFAWVVLYSILKVRDLGRHCSTSCHSSPQPGLNEVNNSVMLADVCLKNLPHDFGVLFITSGGKGSLLPALWAVN